MLRRPVPINPRPDLVRRVRKRGVGGALGMTHFTVIASGYLPNLCDPILGVWLEMSDVWILPGGHDQDTSVGAIGQYQRAISR